MRQQRWFPIVALAVGLFVINLVTRLVIRFGFDSDDAAQNRATIVMFALIGLVLAVWTFLAAQRKRPSRWLPELALGAVAAMLLTVLVGPFVSGGQPFADGAGAFFAQIWLYAGFAIVGTLLGYWFAVMLGRDYRSRSLKAFTQARMAKPRRVVRR
jgi:peptidoglycan/LPS O-acetylase OafA/YrhL